MKRWPLLFAGLVASCVSLAQADDPTQQLLSAMPPAEVSVIVTKHRMGADMVEITVSNESYTSELLGRKISRLGALIGSSPRGVEIERKEISSRAGGELLKAYFAVDGLIDRNEGTLAVEPIVLAFLGEEEPLVSSFQIIFSGESPTPKTLQRFSDENVMLAAQFVPNPAMIEYRIAVKTQSLESLGLPAGAFEPASADPQGQASSLKMTPPIELIILILAAGLGAAALVYLALSRTRRE